jgi:hypothetical protein
VLIAGFLAHTFRARSAFFDAGAGCGPAGKPKLSSMAEEEKNANALERFSETKTAGG